MNIDILSKYHFPNLTADQLEAALDMEEVYELPESEEAQDTMRLLSQFLVGNVSETFKEIKALEVSDRPARASSSYHRDNHGTSVKNA